MAKTPLFSIIACTRNRPELIEHVLFSLRNQSFKDFEVILSDNSDLNLKEKNFQLSKKYHFNGLKYIKPDRVLSMHEHYNFAIEHASGEYVGVITDKCLFRKDALKTLAEILKNETFDILNYQHTGCLWNPNDFLKWISQEDRTIEEPELELFDPKDELERRFSFQYHRARSGKYYNFGKIFFGFYHKNVIQKAKKSYGELFHPFSPDYTSTVLALSVSTKAAFCHKKLLFGINNYMGNGAKGATQPGSAEAFMKSCGVDFEKVITELPIPNIYTVHNLCAYDYEILNRLGNHEHQLDLSNLAHHVAEDMQSFPYKSQDERSMFERSLDEFCKKHNINITNTEKQITAPPKNRIHTNDIIRFLLKGGKFQKLKKVTKNFWVTHHRTLGSLLDS